MAVVSSTPPKRAGRLHWLRQLWVQVLLAMAAGVLVGLLWPAAGVRMQPLSDGFVDLMQMIVAPVIFCAVTSGVGKVDTLGRVGRVGVKALLYFFVLTAVCMAIGLAAADLFQPGAGMHVSVSDLDTAHLPAGTTTTHVEVTTFLLSIVPKTMFSAFTDGDILPVLLVSLLFGLALKAVGEPVAGLTRGVEKLTLVVFKIVSWVMRAAPIGAFGGLALTVSKYGVGSLHQLLLLIAIFSLTCVVVIVVVFGGLLRYAGLSLFKLCRYLKEELLIVAATCSSEAVLPRMVWKMENLGASRPIVGLTMPAGYSFNLDGTAIYLTLSSLFLAQALDIHLSFGAQLTMLGIMLLTSKGAAGVPGGAFVVLASSISVAGHIPVAALALIVGIDRFLNEGRIVTTVLGNAVATVFVAKWEKGFDLGRARAVLNGADPGPLLPPGEAAPRDGIQLVANDSRNASAATT